VISFLQLRVSDAATVQARRANPRVTDFMKSDFDEDLGESKYPIGP
jgi:hypothetical protein